MTNKELRRVYRDNAMQVEVWEDEKQSMALMLAYEPVYGTHKVSLYMGDVSSTQGCIRTRTQLNKCTRVLLDSYGFTEYMVPKFVQFTA